LRVLDEVDQADGQKDRHRVVAAGFEFQQRLEVAPQTDALAAQDGEDGCRVGRGHNRAEQQGFKRLQIEQQIRRAAENQARYQHAERRQNDPLAPDRAYVRYFGIEPPCIQNERKGHDGEQLREERIVEFDPADTFRSGQHSDHQKKQQRWHTEPAGNARAMMLTSSSDAAAMRIVSMEIPDIRLPSLMRRLGKRRTGDISVSVLEV